MIYKTILTNRVGDTSTDEETSTPPVVVIETTRAPQSPTTTPASAQIQDQTELEPVVTTAQPIVPSDAAGDDQQETGSPVQSDQPEPTVPPTQASSADDKVDTDASTPLPGWFY